MKQTINFRFERETKGAVRYQEVGPDGQARTGDADGALIGTLYLRKALLNGEMPVTLKVVVAAS